jgi:hypothetical protein
MPDTGNVLLKMPATTADADYCRCRVLEMPASYYKCQVLQMPVATANTGYCKYQLLHMPASYYKCWVVQMPTTADANY